MINCSSILHFTQYADDTTLGYSCNNIQDLQTILEQEVNKVTKWLTANKLLLNVSKTHSMLFSFKRNVSNLKVRINGTEIEENAQHFFLEYKLF